MATIRTLTDSLRGEQGYGGEPVALKCGVCIEDVKQDMSSPSGTALVYYRNAFDTEQAFIAFAKDVIGKPTGSALDNRLTWST